MTATLISTSPETDSCPRCGQRLAASPQANSRLTDAAASMIKVARGIAAFSDIFVEEADDLNLLRDIFIGLRDEARAAIAKAEGRTP